MRKRKRQGHPGLRALLEATGKSDVAISVKLRWNRQRLSRIMAGTWQPTLAEAAALGRLIGMTFRDYIEWFHPTLANEPWLFCEGVSREISAYQRAARMATELAGDLMLESHRVFNDEGDAA